MPFVPACSDRFARADGALDASSLDDGFGGGDTRLWSVIAGSFVISSGQASVAALSAINNIAVVVMAVRAVDQYVSCVLNASDGGVIVRWAARSGDAAEGSYYFAYRSATNKLQLYRRTTAALVQLGSDGATTVNDGDTIALQAIGSALTVLLNGVAEISQTDANYADGQPGLYGGPTLGLTADDFLFQMMPYHRPNTSHRPYPFRPGVPATRLTGALN